MVGFIPSLLPAFFKNRPRPGLDSFGHGARQVEATWGVPEGIPGLVMTNSSPWYRRPIEIDGLPIKHGDFPWLC